MPVKTAIDLFHNSLFLNPHPGAALSEGEGNVEL
jgi:hypothetical protein